MMFKKVIKLYAVVLNPSLLGVDQYSESCPPPSFLTITSKFKDAFEFIKKLLYIENVEHYKSWCSLKNLDYKDSKSWELYLISINSEKYVI